MIFLLTGESGSGKTTLLNELVLMFNTTGLVAGGFTACGTWESGLRSGFILHDILNKADYPLAHSDLSGDEMQGRFSFNQNTLSTGNRILRNQSENQSIDIIIIDEVGPLELRGKGWAPSLNHLCDLPKPQLWVVRPDLTGQVPEKWKFIPAGIFSVADHNAASVFSVLNEVLHPLKSGK